MSMRTDQLSLLARPEVVVEYRPWDWMCAGDETVPFRGGFCSYVWQLPHGVGFGRSPDAALVDLARDLRCTVDEPASPNQLTPPAQVLAAVERLDTETLAGFLRDHAQEPVLAMDTNCSTTVIFHR